MTYEEIFLKGKVNKAIFVYAVAKYMFENLSYYTGSQTNLVDTIEKFLEQEAKPTLTEDERVILRNLNKEEFTHIGRHKLGDLFLRYKAGTILNEYNFECYTILFQFIKERRRI